jgi:high-affinity nickel-transport protein
MTEAAAPAWRLIGGLAAFNVAAWAWALVMFHDHPALLATALLAYGFGLRHAVDADHIAAIDNVTRKLLQAGPHPLAAGFWFALGHSTVVIMATLAIVLTTATLAEHFAALRAIGAVVGTLVSTMFLLLVGLFNLLLLGRLWRSLRRVRAGGVLKPADHDLLAQGGGVMSRLLRRLFGLVRRPWHMLPLGFLFGLGFDTASEVALMGISATQAQLGLPLWSVLVFPALFTAGMSLIDTTDGVLMAGAYRWAFLRPVRRLYYNITITAMSVVVALLIGLVEGLGLIGEQLALEGWFWDGIGALNDNFTGLGFAIIGAFALTWLGAMVLYRVLRLDRLDVPAANL